MEYIVMDLEWNQCPYGKNESRKNLPFEIIEIGAVKLDDKLNIIKEFHRVIKPQVYTKLHYQTQKVIQLTQSQLQQGISFNKAIDALFSWCSPNSMFCTWGISDLTELQRNMEYYDIENVFPKPLFYYDVQELMSIELGETEKRRTLENAVDYYKIEKNREFHGAMGDAYYTARIMQKLQWKKVKEYYTFNCYRPPADEEEEISVSYPNGSKFVSCEYATKERVMQDKNVMEISCYKCGRVLKPKVKWFAAQQKLYEAVYKCSRHGMMSCKLRFRNTFEGNYYAIRTVEPIDRAGMKEILGKKEQIRDKRRIKSLLLRKKRLEKKSV